MIENKLGFCAAKMHHSLKTHRYIMKILNPSSFNDISGTQAVQSYNPENNISTIKYTAMKMHSFLDLHPLPTNLTKVEEKSHGINSTFLTNAIQMYQV